MWLESNRWSYLGFLSCKRWDQMVSHGLFSNSVKITVCPDISGTWVVLSELLLKGILTKTPSQPARHNECSAKPSAQLVLKTCLVVAVPATIFQKGSHPAKFSASKSRRNAPAEEQQCWETAPRHGVGARGWGHAAWQKVCSAFCDFFPLTAHEALKRRKNTFWHRKYLIQLFLLCPGLFSVLLVLTAMVPRRVFSNMRGSRTCQTCPVLSSRRLADRWELWGAAAALPGERDTTGSAEP